MDWVLKMIYKVLITLFILLGIIVFILLVSKPEKVELPKPEDIPKIVFVIFGPLPKICEGEFFTKECLVCTLYLKIVAFLVLSGFYYYFFKGMLISIGGGEDLPKDIKRAVIAFSMISGIFLVHLPIFLAKMLTLASLVILTLIAIAPVSLTSVGARRTQTFVNTLLPPTIAVIMLFFPQLFYFILSAIDRILTIIGGISTWGPFIRVKLIFSNVVKFLMSYSNFTCRI